MKNTKFPRLTDERVKEVKDFFTRLGIKTPEQSPSHGDDSPHPRPGIDVPFKKFSLLKYEGYVFRSSNGTVFDTSKK